MTKICEFCSNIIKMLYSKRSKYRKRKKCIFGNSDNLHSSFDQFISYINHLFFNSFLLLSGFGLYVEIHIYRGKFVVNLAWASFVGQFVHPVGGEGDGLRDGWEYRYFHHFIIVHDNLVQHLSNNWSFSKKHISYSYSLRP